MISTAEDAESAEEDTALLLVIVLMIGFWITRIDYGYD
jgi:hypothetical protein